MIGITFTPSGGSAYVLADGVSGFARDIRVTVQRNAQVTPGIRWTNVKVLGRYNQQIHVSFQVQRLFDTELHAMDFVLTHFQGGVILPPSAGSLTFNVSGASATDTNTLHNAVCIVAESSDKGATSFHQYQFVGTDLVSGT